MTPDTATPALTIDHVSVRFGGLTAIADMSFVVNEGELVSLIGPNGAGKTTAFNVITGFLKPTGGEVRYRGTALTNLKSHEVANLGLVRTFQKTSVFPNDTVFDNVLTGLHRHGRASVWETLLALPRVRGRKRPSSATQHATYWLSSDSSGGRVSSGARSPTASSACSRWRSPSPRARISFSSTSPYPA